MSCTKCEELQNEIGRLKKGHEILNQALSDSEEREGKLIETIAYERLKRIRMLGNESLKGEISVGSYTSLSKRGTVKAIKNNWNLFKRLVNSFKRKK